MTKFLTLCFRVFYQSVQIGEPRQYQACRLSAAALFDTLQIQIRQVSVYAVRVLGTHTLAWKEIVRSKTVVLRRRISMRLTRSSHHIGEGAHALLIADGAGHTSLLFSEAARPFTSNWTGTEAAASAISYYNA